MLFILMVTFSSLVLVKSEECRNLGADHQKCASWKAGGECGDDLIKKECPRTCGQCAGATNGKWSEWSDWTGCSKTCGGGQQIKFRRCNKPPPYNDGLECLTKQQNRTSYEEEKVKCNTKTCGDACVDKDPESHCKEWKRKNLCEAQSSYHQTMITKCKKTCGFCGSWSEWSNYTTCSVSCRGIGIRVRTRTCQNIGSPAETLYCLTKNQTMGLLDKEVVTCNRDNKCPGCNDKSYDCGYWKTIGWCERDDKNMDVFCVKTCNFCVNGGWNIWSKWTGCSCGEAVGVESRHRECNNPPRKQEGLKCISKNGTRVDDEEETRGCTQIPCLGKGGRKPSQTYIIGAGVAGAVLLILLVIIIVLYVKKRRKCLQEESVLTAEENLKEPPEDHYSVIDDTKLMHTNQPSGGVYEEVDDTILMQTNEPNGGVYEEASSVPLLTNKPSEEEEQTVYAEVGQSGGRIGYILKPDEANYAEVKTEGTYYPPCITTDEPPTYTLPSHDYFSNDRTYGNPHI